MASVIRVNTINSRSGLSTVTFDNSGAGVEVAGIVTATSRVLAGTTTKGHADADELTIASSGRTGMTIRSGSSEYGNIFFSDATSGSGEHQGIFQYYHADDAFIWKSGSSATERLSINAAGVSTFHGDITLEAAGANRISMRHTSGGNAVIKNPTAASLSFGTNNNDNELTIANGGKVGINTTIPSDLLTIVHSANTDDGISIVNTNNSQASAIAQLELSAGDNSHARVQFECNGKYSTIRHDGNGTLDFYTNGSNKRLTIESGGDVSIGGMDANTFSNYRTFTIGGAGAVDGAGIDLERSDGNIYGRFFADQHGVQIGAVQSGDYIRFETGNGTERVRIASGGGIELKTDGKGIEFPTPQTPTNSNPNRVGISSEMRYYETGTFTPGLSSTVLNSLQNEAFTNASYARRVGRYVRVGSLVHVTIEILMASSVTYNSGSTSTAPVCIVGATPFYYAYAQRYDVSGQPDYYPCSISYSSTNLTNDTLYATLRRDFAGEARIEITKPGTGGSRQYNSTNFGEVFPANAHINVSCTYCIDSSNADY